MHVSKLRSLRCEHLILKKHCNRSSFDTYRGKMHDCDGFNKEFSMNVNLDNSVWICTSEKPHNCKVCNEEFSKKDVLNNHLWTHPVKRFLFLKYTAKDFLI